MLCQVLLSTLLAGSPVFISRVTSNVSHDQLALEITGEAALDPGVVKTDLSGSRLVLSLRDTHVRRDNRAWGEGRGTIRAHRHTSHTELEVPLPDGACGGPVKVVATEAGGIRVTVACPGVKAGATTTVDAPVVSHPARPVKIVEAAPARPTPVPALVAVAAPVAIAATALVKAPADDGARLMAALSLESAADVKATAQKKGQSAKAAEPTDPVSTASADVPGVVAAGTDTSSTPPSSTSPSSSWRVVVVPVVALALLGFVSLFLGRRRKSTTRMVTILETASLGPKRALIVARVGGETLVLGSSEAGITLLRSRASNDQAPARDATDDSDGDASVFGRANVADTTPAEDDLQDSPGQVRFLARLFGARKPKGDSVAGAEPWNFEGLLEDSMEDQELRRKLAAGMGARVR